MYKTDRTLPLHFTSTVLPRRGYWNFDQEMDPRHSGEMLKHLENQNDLLMEAYRSMSHELHKLQVEEEMLMRKFYELMSAHGLTKKNEDSSNGSDDAEMGHFGNQQLAIVKSSS